MSDFIGRCIAEQCHATETVALTLTYAGDVVQATSLYYRDVQLMLKRLRKDGFIVRYLCAGEHGELKGRAHWHVVLFFRGKTSGLPLDRRIEWKYWPHGLVYAQHSSYEGFKYVCKYVLKDEGQRGFRKVLRVSKKPPLGTFYFRDLAERMAKARLALHSPEYSFAHCLGRSPDGRYRPRKFWLTGRTFQIFCESYVEAWQRLWGRRAPDTDFLWSAYYDAIAAREVEAAAVVVPKPFYKPPSAAVEYCRQEAFLLLPAPFQGVVVKYSDGTANMIIGDQKWLLDVGKGRPPARQQLAACGLPKWLGSIVAVWLDPLSLASSAGSTTSGRDRAH